MVTDDNEIPLQMSGGIQMDNKKLLEIAYDVHNDKGLKFARASKKRELRWVMLSLLRVFQLGLMAVKI